jgi:hypothetical protein
MWQRVGGVVTTVFDSVKATVKSSINWVIEKLNSLIRSVNSVASKGAGAIGVNIPAIPEIPMLAKGGIVTRPTLAVIGEAGPEAVVPLSGNGARGIGGINIYITGNDILGDDAAVELGDKIVRALKLHQAL